MNQKNALVLLRSLKTPTLLAIRSKTQHFKPKIASVRAKKTPSMMALDHFDFYYGPLYGAKNWPSIRLGLLTPNKFVAVLNRLSDDVPSNEAILRDMPTIEIIEQLTKGKKPPIKKKEIHAASTQDTESEHQDESGEIDSGEDLQSRLEGGIGEFRQPEAEFVYGEPKVDPDSKVKHRSLNDNLVITGMEHIGQQLDTIDDVVSYSRNLKLFTFDRDDVSDFPAPMKDKSGISSWWLLDGASIVPVLALDLQKGEKILDMCASPGGKSLLMAQIGDFDTLVCNDNKTNRLGLLRRALSMYIPVTSELNQKIVLKRKDAADLDTWDEEKLYDKVLLDAPCSTDRLAVNQDEGSMFSIGMTPERLNLPQIQTKLLINALRSAKVGGSVVYSTCSLAPTQNECVVENAAALVKQNFGIDVVEQSTKRLENQLRNTYLFRFSEKCQRGSMIVPNIRSNYGPMYICKLLRTK